LPKDVNVFGQYFLHFSPDLDTVYHRISQFFINILDSSKFVLEQLDIVNKYNKFA
jgi:hypothetical protein